MQHFTWSQNRPRRYTAYVKLEENIDKFNELKISLTYNIGGYSYFSGKTQPRCYNINIKPISRNGNIEESVMMSGNKKHEGGFVIIEPTKRFNQKRFNELSHEYNSKILSIAEAYENDNITLLVNLITKEKAEVKTSDVEVKHMQLLTKEILNKLPPLYTNEKAEPENTKIIVKFFCPWNQWTWYATEYDPLEKRFFGYVKGIDNELGYFNLDELESLKGPMSLKIERDKHYGFEHTLAEVMNG